MRKEQGRILPTGLLIYQGNLAARGIARRLGDFDPDPSWHDFIIKIVQESMGIGLERFIQMRCRGFKVCQEAVGPEQEFIGHVGQRNGQLFAEVLLEDR